MHDWVLDERVRLPEGEIACTRMGEGPPLVLMHGFPGNSAIWRRVAPALARHYRVHLFDMAGAGRSEKVEGQQVYIAGQARVLGSLLAHWGLDRPLVVAHDISAAVAVHAHVRLGLDYARLTLASAAILHPCISRNTVHAQAHLDAYRTFPPAIYRAMLAAQIGSATHRPMAAEVLEGYMAPWLAPGGQEAYFRFVAQIDPEEAADAEAAVTEVRAPTLVLWGEEDSWIDPDHGRRIAASIAGARAEWLPGGGHFLMEDVPGAVVRRVLAFLAEAPA